MSETLAVGVAGEMDDLTASGLLALARDRKAAEERAAADLLEVAARWADLHPAGVDPRRRVAHGRGVRAQGAHRG